MKRQIKKIKTIKSKMISYSLVIILLMTFLSIYSLAVINTYKDQIDAMFQRNVLLKEVQDLIVEVDKELVTYLNSKSSTSLNLYMLNSEELANKTTEINEQILGYSEEELMLQDIISMTNSYLREANLAIEEKLRTDVVAYSARYSNAIKIKSYIFNYINELNIRQFGRNAKNYLYMSEQIRQSNIINIVLIIDLILLSVLIVYAMTNKMINPIIKLSHSAEDIAKGRFDTAEIVVNTDDEIEILAKAFNKMKNSIKTYIEELQTKADTEAKLKDQQVENLKMQSLLDNAKLYALQSQINPHFLFNTINAAVQMAMIEGADRTSEFLDSMSRLFRYNIKQIDSEVTLKQEVENVRDYYELLKVRFGTLIQFQFIIDEGTYNLRMPPLIIQPIVENSYIHGLSSQEEGGTIIIQASQCEGETILVISDTGVGMTQDRIDMIMSEEQEQKNRSEAQSTGIGMRNVIARLELFYDIKGIVSLKSKPGEGTQFIISVPNDHHFFIRR